MSVAKQLRIFISYASKDGAELAQRLETHLRSKGFDPWLDGQRLVGGAVWSQEIERAIDTSDCLLALLTDGAVSSEICRCEQIRAERKQVRIIPVKAQRSADTPLYLEAKIRRDFTQDARFFVELDLLAEDLLSPTSIELPKRYRNVPTYRTAPPQVANYLEQPGVLSALRDAVFAEDHRQPIALTALEGMGGIGKTTLAKALTEDPAVQDAYPDGIVWLTAGKTGQRRFIEEMKEVARALGEDPSGWDSELACQNQYKTILWRKAALIIVDDVWSSQDIKPLLAESRGSRFLFTTRNAYIAPFVGARVHRVDLLSPLRARELLALWAGLPADRLPPVADDIVAECGCLPLALSMIGAMLKGKESSYWATTLNLLKKPDRSAVETLLDGQPSFFRAVELSVEDLKAEEQERYKQLAVLLDDHPAPVAVLQAIWNLDEDDTRNMMETLINRSLARKDEQSKGIWLHDLQLDYARAAFPDRNVLALIHGAFWLAEHAVRLDPYQFRSQMVGRLLPYTHMKPIQEFVQRISASSPTAWLKPLHASLYPPGQALVRALPGHNQRVGGVALSADKLRAISASWDGTLRVWNVETGRTLRILEGHAAAVNCVALSGDGRRAASACWDGSLKVWDVETGEALHSLAAHNTVAHGVALSQDGRCAVSASWDRTLKIWDVENERVLQTLEGHTGGVNGVALTRDGALALSASSDGTLKLWDVHNGTLQHTLEGHTGAVNGVALSWDGRSAVSASSDGTLKVWDVESGQVMRSLAGHTDSVRGVALSRDGRRAVSASSDGTLKVWNVDTGEVLRDLEGHTSAVRGVALSADGRRAVSASSDKKLLVWNLESRQSLTTQQAPMPWVRRVALSRDERRAISAFSNGTLKVWDVGTGLELCTLEGHDDAVQGLALSPDGYTAASASEDGTIQVWDVETGKALRTLKGRSNKVALSGNGRRAFSAYAGGAVRVWDLETGLSLRMLEGHTHTVSGLVCSGDGRLAISTTNFGRPKVWDVDTGEVLLTLEPINDGFGSLALNGEGRLAVSVSDECKLKVWSLRMGRIQRSFDIGTGSIQRVVLSEDGRRAATASWDQTLKVWDVETGTHISTYTCDAPAICCAFIRERVFIGDASGRVHFLHLDESTQVLRCS